jgi:hypothetical protein
MSAEEPAKKFFWFIVYVIWMILDAEGVWERSHLICFLVGTVGTCAIALAEFERRPALIICAFTVLIGGIFYWRIGAAPAPDLGQNPDRPLLSVTEVDFAEGRALSPGPLVIDWTVVNSGRENAKISEISSTPLLLERHGGKPGEAFLGKLPDKPFYSRSGLTIAGQTLNPGLSVHLVTPTGMTLTPDQIAAIRSDAARLYFYGYIKYGLGSEFAFITVYKPDIPGHQGMFIRDDQEYPTYSRSE